MKRIQLITVLFCLLIFGNACKANKTESEQKEETTKTEMWGVVV